MNGEQHPAKDVRAERGGGGEGASVWMGRWLEFFVLVDGVKSLSFG